MNEKKADNKNINNNKNYILNENIYIEKNNITALNDIQDDFYYIEKSIDRCIELIKKSTSSKELNKRLDALSEDNSKNYRDVLRKIDIEREKIEEGLKELRKEIEKEDIREEK